MKFVKTLKLFIFLIFGFALFLPAYADVMPYYTGTIKNETIGFLKVPKTFDVHIYPREDSKIIETINWTETAVKLKNKEIEPSELFVVQIPEKNYAYCMVIDENNGWYQIFYEKSKDKTGWVKADQDDFWTLKDFYSYYGKRHGLFYMKNVDYKKRGLYSGAYNNSQKLGGFTYIKSIKLNKISGNWALVTILDIDSKPKIGYIKWREDNGSIVVFPRMDK